MKVEHGRSRAYYETHCAICSKELGPVEPRYNGHCTFVENDEQLDFYACEQCVKSSKEESGNHVTYTTDIQPGNQEMPPDKPVGRT